MGRLRWAWPWCVLAASWVGLSLGCGGDSQARDAGPGMDGFVFVDGGPRDGARDQGPEPVDAGPDEGVTDADPPPDAARDGGRDSGPVCTTARDCPPGQSCLDGVCVGDPDCCALIDCFPGSTCDPASCSCVGSSGCCFDGFCPGAEEFCDFDTCLCRTFECDPACADGFVCDFGECYPRCFIDERCPPGQVCSFDAGCIDARCTDEECLAMPTPGRCDPTTGCYATCVGDWSWCTSMGGRCFLDSCVDDSCGERAGGAPRFCTYTVDCCGNAVCQHVDDGEPFCPRPCPDPPPPMPVRPDLCVCGFGFGGPSECMDLNFGGGFPGPVPLPGGPPPPID